jgi:PKD repeat protein
MKKILFLLSLLLMTAGCGKDDESTTTPVACFTFTSPETTVFVGDLVEFNNCSTDADSYSWDFGDGSTSTEKNPTHSFDESKQFDVVLVAHGKGDQPKTDTTMLPITVWKKAK